MSLCDSAEGNYSTLLSFSRVCEQCLVCSCVPIITPPPPLMSVFVYSGCYYAVPGILTLEMTTITFHQQSDLSC